MQGEQSKHSINVEWRRGTLSSACWGTWLFVRPVNACENQLCGSSWLSLVEFCPLSCWPGDSHPFLSLFMCQSAGPSSCLYNSKTPVSWKPGSRLIRLCVPQGTGAVCQDPVGSLGFLGGEIHEFLYHLFHFLIDSGFLAVFPRGCRLLSSREVRGCKQMKVLFQSVAVSAHAFGKFQTVT